MILWAAFILGISGSLHCLGMCGPLALSCHLPSESMTTNLVNGLKYNLGRTFSYMTLGLIFGTIGGLATTASLQQSLSVILGILLIGSFLLSINLEHQLYQIKWLNKVSEGVRVAIGSIMARHNNAAWLLGVANGFLPCGLVYLALSGAVASGTMLNGVLFMMIFGLGTIPSLLSLMIGFQWVSSGLRSKLRTTLPYLTLLFGIYLVWRGLSVTPPDELNFWVALTSPTLCH